MFVDEARIIAISGKGGDGAVSFHREKYRPKGGPDGGNGGRGGSVTLKSTESVSSLRHIKDHPHQRARNGEKGKSNNRQGADAPDLEVPVPTGTVVRDEAGTVLADLAEPSQGFVAAPGGRGGRGNATFLSDTRRAPGFAELGEPGREVTLTLELRLIADVAVLGFPNVGKSTLVAAISAARPKIADYPFTTLDPTLGVVEVDHDRFTICDIPGLIEGAAEGKGLGLRFLKHAERAAAFVHLIDVSADRDPLHDLESVNQELQKYRPDLLDRPQVIVLNKIDLVTNERLNESADRFSAQVHKISALKREGIDDLVAELHQIVTKARTESSEAQGFELFRDTGADRFRLEREGSAWRLRGETVERWVAMTDMGNPEAVGYLQNRMERAGVERALAQAGAKHGDEVRIRDVSFEWWPSGSSPPEESVR